MTLKAVFAMRNFEARLRIPEEGSERCSRNVAITCRHICIRFQRLAAMFSTTRGYSQALPRLPKFTLAAAIFFSTLKLRDVILRHSHVYLT